jgi:pilus assembly protein CpaB
MEHFVMNKNRMLALALLAILMSGVVTYLAYSMLRNRLSSSGSTQIVVAVEKLSPGSRITEKQVRLISWSASVPPEGSFTDLQQVIGRGVIVPLSINEPVLDTKLAAKEAGAGLTSVIPEGMRAVAVKVDDVTGVAGFVTPGTHVDVIAIGTSGVGKEEELSKVFLENVSVLAAGQNLEQDEQGKPASVQVVTLLVTPEDSQKLALATSQGRIRLSLRNPMDKVQTNPDATPRSLLYGNSSAAPEPEPVAPRPTPRYRPAIIRSSATKPAAPKPQPEPVAAATPPPVPAKITVEVELIRGDKRETRTFEKKKDNN